MQLLGSFLSLLSFVLWPRCGLFWYVLCDCLKRCYNYVLLSWSIMILLTNGLIDMSLLFFWPSCFILFFFFTNYWENDGLQLQFWICLFLLLFLSMFSSHIWQLFGAYTFRMLCFLGRLTSYHCTAFSVSGTCLCSEV